MRNSFTEENYLKIIHNLSGAEKREVSTNSLAESTETRAASVTDMLRKLASKGLVHYQKYQGVRLTKAGESQALKVIRRHRLWEVFLVEKLEFGWDEVHEIAEELEHVPSEQLMERLDKFLGMPRFDPHGDPIPDKKGEMPGKELQKLSELKTGKSAVVMGVTDHSATFLQYLDKMGLAIGDEIELLETVAYDKSCQVKVHGKMAFLTHKAASNLLIQSL